jgi:hypothetical protein
MKTFDVLIRNTDTGDSRVVRMHGATADEIRERAAATIGPSDVITEVRWTD